MIGKAICECRLAQVYNLDGNRGRQLSLRENYGKPCQSENDASEHDNGCMREISVEATRLEKYLYFIAN